MKQISVMLKKINWRLIAKLIGFSVIAAGFAAGGFLAILGFLPGFSLNPSVVQRGELLEAFVSVLSFSLLAGGLTFALADYIDKENAKQAEKAKLSYEIYNSIFAKLTDPEQEAARRWILENISIKKDDEDLAEWYEKTHAVIISGPVRTARELPEGQNAIKLTLNCFDYIGFIASHYWEVEADSLDWISAPIAKVWRRIGPYVLYIRTLRNTTDYYLSAEHVGKLCVDWRKSKGLPDEMIATNTP